MWLRLEGGALLSTVTALTCLGFLLIGFDNGLMGGLVNTQSFANSFGIDLDTSSGTNMIALIVSIYEIGCFFGAITTSIFGERIGRRRSTLVGIVVMVVGALLQATSYSKAQLITARLISGVGMGVVNSTVPVIQAEFSPKSSRGVYVCAQVSTLNFGIMMVYWIDYALNLHDGTQSSSYTWRVPMILQWIFLLPMVLIILVIPETPRWLASHRRGQEALDVLTRLNKGKSGEEVQLIYNEIVDAIVLEAATGAGTWKDLFKDDDVKTRRRFLIACSIQIFQQLSGINALIYYSTTLFSRSLGFDSNLSSLMSGVLNTCFFIASFIPWALIDRSGRRPLLLSMVSVMAIVMACQAGLIYQVENETSIARTAGMGAAAMLFVFQTAFTVGCQATVWVYPSEILPLKVRQRGSSVSTACNWIINFVIVYITPPAIRNIGWKTYVIFGVLNMIWLPIIYFCYPETRQLALEDVDKLFVKSGHHGLLTGALAESTGKEETEHKGGGGTAKSLTSRRSHS